VGRVAESPLDANAAVDPFVAPSTDGLSAGVVAGSGDGPAGGAPSPRRRADAERNHAAIVEAALALFAERPEATMAEVAAAAGVGRVTLYAHFPSRQALVEAVVDRAVAETVAQPAEEVSPDAPAGEALRAMVRSSWRALHRFGRLSAMVQRELTPERLRDHHGPVLDEVDALVARGQADGSFRSDLPRGWLVTTIYSLVHAAADEVDAGRLDPAEAAGVLEATLLPALAPPGPQPPPVRPPGAPPTAQ
jgi:AcrR family transcriptional regulator